MIPNGVSSARPPALMAPLVPVWHTAQLPSAASSAPRAIVATEKTDASGRAIGAIARQGNIAAPTPMTADNSAAMPAKMLRRFVNGLQLSGLAGADGGGGRIPDTKASSLRNPFKMRSGVNGGSLKRTPVASKIAFAMAA